MAKEISEYWRNQGVTQKSEGRIYEISSAYLNELGIYSGCNECCNGDRCDDPSHRRRPYCHACLGTGQNLTSERFDEEKKKLAELEKTQS